MERGQQLSITIATAFGLVFVLINSAALPTAAATALRVAAVVAFIAVQVAVRRGAPTQSSSPASPPPTRFGRGYWTVVAVEVVALIAGVQVLARVFELPEAGVAWVSVVVGLHFVALALVWREASLHALAAGLTLCGVVGLVLAFAGAATAAVATVGGVLPGFCLLGGGAAAVALAKGDRKRQPV